MNKNFTNGLFVGAASVLLLVAGYYFGWVRNANGQVAAVEAKQPLYWVAPMDANFRRDKPGKSPMGMDLTPVFPTGNMGAESSPGTIRIAPNVINNLGVRSEAVQYKNLDLKITTVGYVAFDEAKLVHIHPRLEGWIEKLYITASGDPVQRGQPLYDLYSPALVNAQEEFVLALARNNKRLVTAAENRLAALHLPAKAIAALKRSQKVQQTVTVTSPQSGIVNNLNVRDGFFVKPGTNLMSIGNLSSVWVEAEVFERQAPGVIQGMRVTMTLDYLPGKVWQGQVDYVHPVVDVKTRTVKVRLIFNNEDGVLKPNMFTQIVLHAQPEKPSLVISKAALIRTGRQDRVVLDLGGGQFKSVAVLAGRFDDTHVEVLSGLALGDTVVTSAQFLLDSESSKSSDFKRMSGSTEMQPLSKPMTHKTAEVMP